MLPPLAEHAEELARLGVRGVIVADLGLLSLLRDRALRRLGLVASHARPFELVASTLLSAFNGASVAFLARAGATRVVLPRELSAEEICALAREARVPVEAVAMRGRCPNVEGFCTHLHDDPSRTWPCELRYAKSWSGEGEGIPPFVERALRRDEGTDRHFSCGLCAVPLLARAGVRALKVVGRGAETERKASAVAAVAAMIAWGEEGGSPDGAACAARGKDLFRLLHGRPCRRENCYFPEFGPEGDEE
jgi:putative protease